jgi:hypothetical protein
MGLPLDDGLSGAPPLERKARVTGRALFRVDPRGIERQAVALDDFFIHHDGLVRALGDAQAALKAFLSVYFISHVNLQIMII